MKDKKKKNAIRTRAIFLLPSLAGGLLVQHPQADPADVRQAARRRRDHRRGPLPGQGAGRGHERIPPHRRDDEHQLRNLRHGRDLIRRQHLRHHGRTVPDAPHHRGRRRHRAQPGARPYIYIYIYIDRYR